MQLYIDSMQKQQQHQRYKATLDSLKIHVYMVLFKQQAPPWLTYINTIIMQYIMLKKTAGDW